MTIRTETETVIKKILPYLRRRGYSPEKDLDFETAVKLPDRYNKGYIDILVTCGDAAPKFVIEAKKSAKVLTDKDRAQAIGYGVALKVPFVVVTNGTTIQCLNTNTKASLQWNGQLEGCIPTKAQLPSVLKALRTDKLATNVLLSVGKNPDTGLPFHPGLPLKQLNAMFARCHNAIRKIEKNEEFAFADFSKLLFLKLLEEKQDDGDIELPYSYRFDELAETPQHKSDQIRDSVRKMIAQIRKDTAFGDVLEDEIHLKKPETFRYIVEQLAAISFRDSTSDSKGAAFEYFVRATLKGKRLGQYFTPRPLVELMVAMIGSEKIANAAISTTPIRILDPACGTGGFLVYALRHSIEILSKKLEESVISRRVFDDGKKRLMRDIFFGSEASEGVACAAKMNMIVAGDGHTNIIPEDSLRVGSKNWHMDEATCDVILTNPPFGTSEADSLPTDDQATYPIRSTKGQHLFLQRMVLAAVPEGDICTVIDDGVLNTDSAGELRKWLLEQCRLVAVLSLPDETFKPNKINVKSSVLYLKRREDADANHVLDHNVIFCDVDSLGYEGSGEAIRGFDFPALLESVSACVRSQTKARSGVGWNAFDVKMSNIWKDTSQRLDLKFWSPEQRKQIATLQKSGAPTIKELATKPVKRGKSPSSELYVDERDGYALVIKSGTNISKLGNLLEDGDNLDYVEKNIYDEMPGAQVQDGDVLLSSTGDGTLGKCCVYRSTKQAIADGHVTIIRADQARVLPEYLCDYLRAGLGAREVERLYSGSTGMIELTPEHVNSIFVDILDGNLKRQKLVSDALRAGERAATLKQEEAASDLKTARLKFRAEKKE